MERYDCLEYVIHFKNSGYAYNHDLFIKRGNTLLCSFNDQISITLQKIENEHEHKIFGKHEVDV